MTDLFLGVGAPGFSLHRSRGTRIVGQYKSGSESASRSPNDTQKNDPPRSIIRMGRSTFWHAINWDC